MQNNAQAALAARRFNIEAKGTVTGGATTGTLLPGVDRNQRRVYFNLLGTGGFSKAQLRQGWKPRRTWVITHGWNSNADNFTDLANVVRRANPNDLILTLDWREAANTGINLLAGDNGKASTWIGAVADFAAQKLKDWGLTRGNRLNLVGHSLGALLGSEIAARFGRAKTITALDPPSEVNLPDGYDLDGRNQVPDRPRRFDSVSTFSRSFVGSRSIAGNKDFASQAAESIQMDFGFRFDTGQEHGWVIETFSQLVSSDPTQINLANGLFTLNDLQPHPEFKLDTFDQLQEGAIRVNEPNQPIFFVARNAQSSGEQDDIVYGTNQDDLLLQSTSDLYAGGSDIFYGGAGDDAIEAGEGNDRLDDGVGNDVLIGGAGGDLLIGAAEADLLTGDSGADRFVFAGETPAAALATSLLGAVDRITDFSLSEGDRFQLDVDNNLITSNRPKQLFNGGTERAQNLASAVRSVYGDRSQQRGDQALGANQAVLFEFEDKTYLSINDRVRGFAPSRDLVVEVTGIDLQAGAGTGALSVADYFV